MIKTTSVPDPKTKAKKPKLTFPCLRKHKTCEMVILFSTRTTGMVIHITSEISPYDVGDYSRTWHDAGGAEWEPYHLPITLQDEE